MYQPPDSSGSLSDSACLPLQAPNLFIYPDRILVKALEPLYHTPNKKCPRTYERRQRKRILDARLRNTKAQRAAQREPDSPYQVP